MLTIHITSFAFKNGYPENTSGHGGGFVFDCRGILNPGRIEEHKTQTGMEEPVANYLERNTQMPDFIDDIKRTIRYSIENYLERGFSDLDVNFGCTGGQHRSVYAAEQITKYIKETWPQIQIKLKHREQKIEKEL